MRWPCLERVYGNQGLYMTRLIFGRLRFHVFWRGDEDPDPHTPPWDFWTYPLRGYYEEILCTATEPMYWCHQNLQPGDTYTKLVHVEPFKWHYRPANHCHRVMYPDRTAAANYHISAIIEPARARIAKCPIRTIVWTSKIKQPWGFLKDGKFIPWREYIAAKGLTPLQ